MKRDGEKLTVAAIGDLHVKDDRGTPLRDLFCEISDAADVLVLCGDLTDTGQRSEAEILSESLRDCAIPVVAVLGNHDFDSGQEEQVKGVLRQAHIHLLEGQSCEIGGVGFAGVKGFAGGFGPRMLGSFGEPAIKAFVAEAVAEAMRLENAMRAVHTERSIVVLHYAPVTETLEGEPPEIFPYLGCSRLAETIDRFRASAVFHGHAHHGKYHGRTPGGVPVYNVAWPVEKPSGRDYALVEI